MLNASVAATFAGLGFNALRYPMMWAAAMPKDGEFDSEYLMGAASAVASLWCEHGVVSLLDMHQDVLSSLFGSYDGAPQWLVNRTKPRHAYPWPLRTPLKSWALGYATEAVGQAFQDIYDNKHGGLDAWAAFWRRVASLFAGREGVLGYELMNEPWAGDVFARPELLLPGEAGARNLLPAYERVAAAIREVDTATLIFYEPVTWGMVFAKKKNGSAPMGSGFASPPGGAAYADRSVFSYHYYCWFASRSVVTPLKPLARKVCDQALGPQVFRTVDSDVARLGGSSFMTEFGGFRGEFSNASAAADQLHFVLDQADLHLQSWAYWDMNALFSQNTFEPLPGALDVFVRTYAPAVAGVPLSMSFNRTTAAFSLVYTPNSSCALPTEVFTPGHRYPRGYRVGLSAGLSWRVDAGRPSFVLVSWSAAGAAPGPGVAVVNITRR